ncbi:MAG: TerC family protein [Verrucomicrobiales bacterium]|nr:TerC family protein [Verrucomicrobiales bacterium]
MLAEFVITSWHWATFLACILFLLALDLGVFHRAARVVQFKEALGWTGAWFCLAMGFAALIATLMTKEKALLFATGYIVELSLSMDNVFVIAVIFRYFQVPIQYQHRVLFWGILGALAMRGVMIWLGAAMVERFEWTLYILGAFLIFTGLKMIFSSDEGVHPEKNPVIRLARRWFPVADQFDGQKFFTQVRGSRALTPLAIVLIMVETTDLIFALDSLPAIFGITQDAFIIFTSNVFAILGLRSLYFALAEAIQYFTHLKVGLSAVLVFIGIKMVGKHWFEIPTLWSLIIVAGIILSSILVSLIVAARPKRDH